MNKLVLLFLILVFGTLFLVTPKMTEAKDYFLFSDMKLHWPTHVYFILERVTLIILSYIIVAEEKQYRYETKVFFWLMVADLADYILSYNTVWFRISSIPISMNVVSVLIFGFVISRAWMKQLRHY